MKGDNYAWNSLDQPLSQFEALMLSALLLHMGVLQDLDSCKANNTESTYLIVLSYHIISYGNYRHFYAFGQ